MIRLLLCIFILFLSLPVFAATTMYIDTEQKYIFTDENIAKTIPDFVTDENKQVAMAQKYIAVMNPENGAVSIANLFEICRAGGMNTYRASGFQTCRDFVAALLMDAGDADGDDLLGGFCPGLDEKGKNPNGLQSITDKTRIGDFCSSTNIYSGEVIFRKGYNCTCLASACNKGFHFKGGRCLTDVQPKDPFCPRSSHVETKENNTTQKCVDFCGKVATKNNCKYKNVVMQHSTKHCICNADVSEVDAALESMKRAAAAKAANTACPTTYHAETPKNNTLSLCTAFCGNLAKQNNCKHVHTEIRHSTKQCICNPTNEEIKAAKKYYEVCGKAKGKTGKKEYCVSGVFNWRNVQRMQAVAIAQEYARVKHGKSIVCNDAHRTAWLDDYIKCTATDDSAFYEFKYDDIKESIDSAIDTSVMKSICSGIYGGSGARECSGISASLCSGNFATTAKRLGYNTQFKGGKCVFVELHKDSGNKIKEIAGIDSYRFYSGDMQIQAFSDLEPKLCGYIKNVKSGVSKCTCVQHPDHMSKIDGHTVKGSSDDVIRCTFNGNQEVDFVFDDLAESFDYVSEKGHSGIQCIISGGKFSGSKCHGLDRQQCIDAGKKLQQTIPGTSGTRWDGQNCILKDASEAETYDGVINVGLGLVGAVDCVAGTHVGCVLFAVEGASMTLEMTTGYAMNARADDFLSVSTKCHSRSCALSTIRDLGGKVMSVHGGLGDSTSRSVDEELARLIEYLEPSDLGQLLGTNNVEDVIRQLGGDPDDWGGRLLRWGNTAGLIGQFASIGASGLRLTGRAVAKVAGIETKVGRAATKMANFLGTSKKAANAADAASDAARGAGRADDAARAASRTGDVADPARSTDNVSDALRRARNMTFEEELREVGITVDKNGRYHDLRNGNQFISYEDVLKRIDDLPYETERAAARRAANAVEAGTVSAHTDDTARAVSGADNAANGTRTGDAVSDVARSERESAQVGRVTENISGATVGRAPLDQRLKDIGYNQLLEGFKSDGVIGHMDASMLTADEWAALSRRLESEGIELVYTSDKYGSYYHFGRKASSGTSSVGHAASNAASDAAASARKSSNTDDAINAARRAEEMEAQRLANQAERQARAQAEAERLAAQAERQARAQAEAAARAEREAAAAAREAAETENVVALKTNQALQADGYERIAIVSEIEGATPTRYGTVKMDWADEEFVIDAIIKRKNGELTHSEHLEAVRRLDKYFDENAARRYAMEMRQYLIDMPEGTIFKMIDNIGDGNGIDAAQLLVDYLAPKYGIEGKIEVIARHSEGLAQYSTLSDGRKVILFNSSLGSVEPEQFINLLTHEFSHAVDDLAPHNGAIGLKLNAYGDIKGLYPDKVNDIYKLIPTERSSHIVGDIVSGRTNYGRGPSKDGLPTLYQEWIKRLSD